MGQDYSTNQQGQHCCWCLLQVTQSDKSRWGLLQMKGRNQIFTGHGLNGVIQLPQNFLEVQPNRTHAIQGVSGVHFRQLSDTSDWWFYDERWSDDLILTNKQEQVRDAKAGDSLGCSDLAVVEFRILRAVIRAKSRIITLDLKGADSFSRSNSFWDGLEDRPRGLLHFRGSPAASSRMEHPDTRKASRVGRNTHIWPCGATLSLVVISERTRKSGHKLKYKNLT